jgi:hypothetical protein
MLYHVRPPVRRASPGSAAPCRGPPRPALYVSHPDSRWTPNHARRLRLEKLLHLGLSRSPNGFFKALLDPGGGFTSENTARRFQKRGGRYETVSEVKRLHIYNGYI